MLRKLVAVAALGLIAPLGGPALAHAAPFSSWTIIDQPGDMWKVPGEGPLVAAPHQRRGDIRRTIIRHGDHAITVRAKFSELARKPQHHALVVGLRTSAGMRRDVSLFAGKLGRRAFWRGSVLFERANGRPVNCATAHRINYTTNVMRLRVPRACLDTPRWVQANVFSLGKFGRPIAQAPGYFDTAHGPQRRIKNWTPRLGRP